jgi:hypothetical protein
VVGSLPQILTSPEVIIEGLSVVMPVKSELAFDIEVAVIVLAPVFAAPNLTHGRDPVYWPADIDVAEPVTSPST